MNIDDILLTPLHSTTGEPVNVLNGHLDQISGIQILSDYRVISVGHDGMIFLWDESQHIQDLEDEQVDWLDDVKDGKNGDDNDIFSGENEFIPNILRNYLSDVPL